MKTSHRWGLGLGLLVALGAEGQALAASPSFGVVSPNQKVRPMEAPATSPSASLLAARNEFEAFQVVLTAPGGDATGLSLALSKPLAGPNGATLPADAVTLYREAYYDVGTPSNTEGAAGLWPDPLVPDVDVYVGEKRNAFPFDVPQGESRAVWVDILVPDGATPGDYDGELTVSQNGQSVGTIPVSLHVGTFSLPSTATLASTFGMGWADPCIAHTGDNYCGDPNFDEHAADSLRALYVRAALDHRFTISPIDFQPPFGGSAAPFESTLLPYITGTAPTRLPGAKVTSVVLDGGAATLSSWIDYAKQKGFFDRLVYYPVDEPGAKQTAWDNFITQANALHQADAAARILITSSIQDADAAGASDVIDVFVPVIDQLENRPDAGEYAGNQRSKYDAWLAAKPGRALWSYQSCDEHGCGACGTPSPDPSSTGWPNRVIDSSGVQDRAFPWQAFRLGVTGELYFDTSYQLGSAWDADGQCAFSGSGDGTLFYPGKPSIIGGQTDIPVESIRMKLIREGMEDYEYLALVAQQDPAKAKSAADALFPHTYESAQPPEALESVREALFELLDEPAAPGTGAAVGATGAGGGASGSGGGADAAGGAGGQAVKSADGAAPDDGCGCRVAPTREAPMAGLVGLALALGAATRRRRRDPSRRG